jgi:hypothetical protein
MKNPLTYLKFFGALMCLAVLPSAHGQVTFSLVSGAACGGATSATYTPGGATQTVTLCVTTGASNPFCGASIRLRSAVGESGLFTITNRTLGTVIPDATTAAPPYPVAIDNPATGPDMGGTPSIATPTAGGATSALATFTIQPTAGAVASSYVISTDTFTDLSTPNPNCATPTDPTVVPTQANFTFNRAVTPSTAVFTISTPVNLTEGGGTANATVTCTGTFASNQTLPVSLAFTTTNAAGNFTNTASPLSFAACGGATQQITVTPRAEDAVVQGAVAGSIVLTAPAAGVATLGNPSTAVVIVADNDTPPVFSMGANTGTCAEPGTNCAFVVNRDSGLAASTVVNFTAGGAATRSTTGTAGSGDYYLATTSCAPANVIAGNTITHPNASPFTVNVCVLDDTTTEAGGEAVTFTLAAGAPAYTLGATTSRSQTIADDDGPPSVSVAVAGSPATENGGVLTYTFTRTGNAAQIAAALSGVNVTFPAANARYSLGAGCTSPISFAATVTTATCVITGVDNAVVDGNINVAVTVASGSGYTVGAPATATGQITDNENGVGVLASGGAITEGGLATFTLSCTGTGGPFNIPYTINTVGTDGAPTPATPVALTCGTPVNVTVQTAQNTTTADSRTLTLTLGAPPAGTGIVPGQGAASVAVQDDDGPPPMVPTMGVLGLGLLSLLIAGFGALTQRRRK